LHVQLHARLYACRFVPCFASKLSCKQKPAMNTTLHYAVPHTGRDATATMFDLQVEHCLLHFALQFHTAIRVCPSVRSVVCTHSLKAIACMPLPPPPPCVQQRIQCGCHKHITLPLSHYLLLLLLLLCRTPPLVPSVLSAQPPLGAQGTRLYRYGARHTMRSSDCQRQRNCWM
jgi:hypothetical protein